MFAVQTFSGAEYLLVQMTCRYGIWDICMYGKIVCVKHFHAPNEKYQNERKKETAIWILMQLLQMN